MKIDIEFNSGAQLPMNAIPELARLAERDETGAEDNGHRRGQREAASLDPGDLGDAEVPKGSRHFADELPEGTGVAENRCDVLEHHTLLGKIWDVSDQGFELAHQESLR